MVHVPAPVYIQVHRLNAVVGKLPTGHEAPGLCSLSLLHQSYPTACPSGRSSAPTEIHLHLVHAGWGPDRSVGRGRGPSRLIATAATRS